MAMTKWQNRSLETAEKVNQVTKVRITNKWRNSRIRIAKLWLHSRIKAQTRIIM
jgi:hypothetical protein